MGVPVRGSRLEWEIGMWKKQHSLIEEAPVASGARGGQGGLPRGSGYE